MADDLLVSNLVELDKKLKKLRKNARTPAAFKGEKVRVINIDKAVEIARQTYIDCYKDCRRRFVD